MCWMAGDNVTDHEFLARLTYPSINVQNTPFHFFKLWQMSSRFSFAIKNTDTWKNYLFSERCKAFCVKT